MQSGFIDFRRVVGHLEKTSWNPLFVGDTPDSELQYYVTYCKKYEEEILRFKDHPIHPSDDIYSAIVCLFQTLQSALENGEDPNFRDMDYSNPLHYACTTLLQGPEFRNGDQYYMRRDKLRIKVLLSNKADLNAQCLTENTPLQCAVLSRRLELANFLLDQGADAKIASSQGQTILHLAAKQDEVEVINRLIRIQCLIEAQDRVGWTPLHLAILSKRDSIKILIGAKALLKPKGKRFETTLKLADDHGLLDLFEHRFYTDIMSFLTLKAAVNNDRQDEIRRAMEDIGRHSWPPINNDKEDPIAVAADHGNSEVIEKMMQILVQWDSNSEKMLRANDWESALTKAVQRGHLGVVTTLVTNLEKSAPGVPQKLPNTTGENTQPTDFLYACIQAKQLDIFEFFVRHGVNIKIKDSGGRDLLHSAAWSDPSMTLCKGIIERLARTKWSPDIELMRQEENDQGQTYKQQGRYYCSILFRASQGAPF
ncbi:hypothetical protein NW752_012474 [Fusarium irregulare]|uniref:Ankyrin n=1 Tax=Fusarium irregulare TaxID=2494466 RepID=A0A9W8PKQ0_9HYPO|nr:hypothetical protein NW752_012474 [Fusarium irregulare]KAJ4009430.1 hypothetical protein NW766_008547 [Fusarium irregulare]